MRVTTEQYVDHLECELEAARIERDQYAVQLADVDRWLQTGGKDLFALIDILDRHRGGK